MTPKSTPNAFAPEGRERRPPRTGHDQEEEHGYSPHTRHAEQLEARILHQLRTSNQSVATRLHATLKLLAKHRGRELAMQVCEQDGERIPTGIFRNMRMPPACAVQAPNSKLLGTFENAIQGLLEKVRGRPYETIRCLGCRDGYYAVGLARLFPGATVYSQENDYLSSPAADGQDAERTAGEHELLMSLNSEQLATLNKVYERVIGYRDSQAGDTAKPDTEELQFLYAQDMDALTEILARTNTNNAYRNTDILAGTTKVVDPCTLKTLKTAFRDTHDFDVAVDLGPRKLTASAQCMDGWNQLDRLIAAWDWEKAQRAGVLLSRRGRKP